MPTVPNLDYIRSQPEWGPRLYEALTTIIQNMHNDVQQQNGNVNGQPTPPPQVNGLTVSASNGHFSAAITDQNDNLYRGVQYYLAHSDNPSFTNPQIEHLGNTRNWSKFLGNSTRYFMAYSSYGSSAPSAPVYHGSLSAPAPVVGGGSIAGAEFQTSQGSGTGSPGVAHSGPGPIAFRTSNGAPPKR